ncbi:hypothetical protein P154DRAFT_172716 [Amniculicola lignicola CBS 123094]|uniref:Uncharacterized protein n=1 Tax=Amniculicola lignicola CBS 123094 TaxID=1392246 RepID=A0A6A5WJQ9_9PLEO|nr:hypothetical protein P154DRAFT_172716 [Amniculicola lignicola CBS 123094]
MLHTRMYRAYTRGVPTHAIIHLFSPLLPPSLIPPNLISTLFTISYIQHLLSSPPLLTLYPPTPYSSKSSPPLSRRASYPSSPWSTRSSLPEPWSPPQPSHRPPVDQLFARK